MIPAFLVPLALQDEDLGLGFIVEVDEAADRGWSELVIEGNAR